MYRLDRTCGLRNAPIEFDQDPRDIEDLAFRQNTVWFADVGDNGAARANVALISVSYDPAATQARPPVPEVFRLGYPDGPRDAEALLLAPDGTPYIVTKDVLGRSSVYRPAAPLDRSAEVALEKVADVEFAMTGTPGGPLGRAGQLLVTGGAVSADGSRIALRTYTDAHVWPLVGSDVVGALRADPVAVVALPDAPQGEAISFAADSRSLLVGSEGVNSVITAVPALPQPATPEAPATDTATATPTAAGAGAPFSAGTGGAAGRVTAGVGVAVVAGGLLWVLLRVRRRGGSRPG